MRREQDSMGEFQLAEDEYFGIGTARLLSVVEATGPCLPKLLAVNVVRVRQAQAQLFGSTGAWSEHLAETIMAAGEKVVADELDLSAQVAVRMLHGGGARSLVVNIDEVLANVALELKQRPKGEYHLLAPLFQQDGGFSHQNVFLVALHISLVQEVDSLLLALMQCLNVLRQQAERFKEQKTLATLHFQAVKITDVGSELGCCAESLARTNRMLNWYRAELLQVWCESPDFAAKLSVLVGVDVLQAEGRNEFPVSVDLFSGVSSLFKTMAMSLLQLCNALRFLVGMSKELDVPKRCTGPVFNPAAREMLIPDTVSQIAFQIIGNDASLVAAMNAGANGVSAYLPLVATHLIDGAQLLTAALNLLGQNYLAELNVNEAVVAQMIDITPLQAEKLIPLLGYDRAVQVARIAAITEKPVRTVVIKMKLMTEQQAEVLFARARKQAENE